MRFPCKQRVLREPMPFLGAQLADYFNPRAPSVPPAKCLEQCRRDLAFLLLYFFLIFFPPSPSVTIPLEKMTRPLMATISSHQPLRKERGLMGTSSLYDGMRQGPILPKSPRLLCVHGYSNVVSGWQCFMTAPPPPSLQFYLPFPLGHSQALMWE